MSTGRTYQEEIILVGLAVLILAAWVVGELIHTWTHVTLSVDTIAYDLPVIGHWIQSGSVWPVTELFPLQTHGTYPQSSDLVLAAAILPFHNDAFLRFPAYGAFALTWVALYAAGRAAGAVRSLAVLFATAFMVLPTTAWLPEVDPPDVIGLAAFAVGLLFCLRRARTGRTSDLMLAAVGLGFAAGSRWYFSSAVAVLGLGWALLTVLRGFPLAGRVVRVRWHAAAIFLATVLVTGGFWLVRNWVKTGDPFFPVRIALGSFTVFNAPHDIYRAEQGFSIAHYLTNGPVLRHYFLPAWRETLSLGGLILLIPALACLGIPRFRRNSPAASLLLLLAATSIVLAGLYFLTPYSAFGSAGHPTQASDNVRYALPAMCLMVPIGAVLVGYWPRWARLIVSFAIVPATLLGADRAYRVLNTGRSALAFGITFVVAAMLTAFVVPRRFALSRLRRWSIIGAVTGSIIVTLGAYAIQHRLNSSRYAPYDPTFAWVGRQSTRIRIGLAGSFNFKTVPPAWPLFGKHIENTVEFVGRLHQGHLTQFRTRIAWLRAVRSDRLDFLEITLGTPPPPTSDQEVSWAAESHFPVLARSSHFEVVKVIWATPSRGITRDS